MPARGEGIFKREETLCQGVRDLSGCDNGVRPLHRAPKGGSIATGPKIESPPTPLLKTGVAEMDELPSLPRHVKQDPGFTGRVLV